MTKDEIIEIASQVYGECVWHESALLRLEAFVKLVAAKERKVCANLCWKSEDDNAFVNSYNGKRLDLLCAELIRARGEQA